MMNARTLGALLSGAAVSRSVARKDRMWKTAVAVAASCLLNAGPLWGQGPAPSWRIVPQLGVTFHGGYYDDLVVTTFADGDVDTDNLSIDPGTSLRIGATAERALTPVVWLYAGLAASWPDADVAVNSAPRSNIDMTVLELSAGALVRLGQWGSPAKAFPFYVGGGLTVAWHSYDDLIWQGQPTDVTTTSLGLNGMFGVEYSVGPSLTLRGEARALFMRGGFGGLEDELARAAARDEGQAARTELDSGTFGAFSLIAGLAIDL